MLRGNRNMPMAPEPVDQGVEDETVPPPDDFSNAPEATAAPTPEMTPEGASAGSQPGAAPTPQPTYTPGPYLPTAPNTVQPLQPFPQPTPTAPPQGAPQPGQGAEGMPFMP